MSHWKNKISRRLLPLQTITLGLVFRRVDLAVEKAVGSAARKPCVAEMLLCSQVAPWLVEVILHEGDRTQAEVTKYYASAQAQCPSGALCRITHSSSPPIMYLMSTHFLAELFNGRDLLKFGFRRSVR